MGKSRATDVEKSNGWETMAGSCFLPSYYRRRVSRQSGSNSEICCKKVAVREMDGACVTAAVRRQWSWWMVVVVLVVDMIRV